MSVRPDETTRLPLDGFSLNFISEYFSTICQENSSFIKLFFLTHGSLHHNSMLIKRSNLMQQYADIYLLHSHSTCFGCHSTHHQEY